ncbi:MAG: glucosidase [Planctomycetota bacterium]|nr:MAG: glucosidase [Planctomycetota bacterium]
MAKLDRRPNPGARTAEERRLADDARQRANWKRWGPYLAERQWGTVREDYSGDGSCWTYFPHDHARSRAYRWGEDGLLGICDRQGRLCFALALWNERDPILKERLFGVTGAEGNHGEDVKELYHYLDATPTGSYLKALYRYPQAEFPYARLVDDNRARSRAQTELELEHTGAFDAQRWFDVVVEYAKAAPDDIYARITVTNRAAERARVHVLPTLWFRNTWSWGRGGEGYWAKPRIELRDEAALVARHESLGEWHLRAEPGPEHRLPEWWFTENESNNERLFGSPNAGPYVKDAFHERLVDGREDATNPAQVGTKAAAHYELELDAGASATLRLRLCAATEDHERALGAGFDKLFARRAAETDEFYAARIPTALDAQERNVARQAYAGLLWSKQFFHYVVADWLEGDPSQPAPPAARKRGRNASWRHLYNRDVVSMPDKWEYPWYAAWDLAFHMLPMARVDVDFAKQQLLLFLREWYMHPNGQLPAYEFALEDVNPPVHAWACWRVYKLSGPRGARDRDFLARSFQKLLLNFTWWVNRKDAEGNNLFSGGFLGLDNIGVFDRSQPLPTGGHLEQADGTAWMAFYAATMMVMALELAEEEPAYEDLASKFFEHFVSIADAMNTLGGSGLWDEQDGFYYDHLRSPDGVEPLRIRSMVGLVPLFAVSVLEEATLEKLPGFHKRLRWFLKNRIELARHLSYAHNGRGGHHLLAIPSRERLVRVLRYALDEREFLSPHGLRSLSRAHAEQPYVFRAGETEYRVAYAPAESTSALFGGNSNWRGPVWFPVNYLLIEALERFHHYYGDGLKVECPTGSGQWMTLQEVAGELSRRLTRLFVRGADGRRPSEPDELDARGAGEDAAAPLLFHEYFDGDTGRGLGASHQTGWTALVVRCLEDQARARAP